MPRNREEETVEWHRKNPATWIWKPYIGSRKVNVVVVRHLHRFGWGAYSISENGDVTKLGGSAWASRHQNCDLCMMYAIEWVFEQQDKEEYNGPIDTTFH